MTFSIVHPGAPYRLVFRFRLQLIHPPRFRFAMDELPLLQVLFKQFFATAVMGLGHGLILLPVLLSLVGPASYRFVHVCFTITIKVDTLHSRSRFTSD